MSHPNNPDQIKIDGFSRLLIQCTDVEHLEDRPSGYPSLQHSGSWISKDRNFLIVPTSGRAGYQLLPISQDAGLLMYKHYISLIGTIEYIMERYHKLIKSRDSID